MDCHYGMIYRVGKVAMTGKMLMQSGRDDLVFGDSTLSQFMLYAVFMNEFFQTGVIFS